MPPCNLPPTAVYNINDGPFKEVARDQAPGKGGSRGVGQGSRALKQTFIHRTGFVPRASDLVNDIFEGLSTPTREAHCVIPYFGMSAQVQKGICKDVPNKSTIHSRPRASSE